MQSVSFRIVNDIAGEPLVISDTGGPTDTSVTNAAEMVVATLVKEGKLPPGRRLLYYDSLGTLDELVVKDGRFAGFKPGGFHD